MPVIEPMNGDGSARVVVNDVEDAGIVELVGPSSVDTAESSISISDDQIAPLLIQSERPKINIFTISYPRQKLNKVNSTLSLFSISIFVITNYKLYTEFSVSSSLVRGLVKMHFMNSPCLDGCYPLYCTVSLNTIFVLIVT